MSRILFHKNAKHRKRPAELNSPEGRKKPDKNGAQKSRSLYFYIFRAFMILIAADFLLAAFLLILYRYVDENNTPGPIGEQITRQLSVLKSGDYQKLKLKKALGRGGYYEILNENAKVLFTSRSSEKNSYSRVVLSYIPDIDKDSSIYAIPFEDKDGTGFILVRTQYETGKTSGYYSRLKGIIVLNGKQEIQYSTLNNNGKKITENELDYILEASDVNETEDHILQKYAYTDSNGQKRYLLIHSPVGNRSAESFASRWAFFSILIFAAGVLLSIFIAGFLIMKRVRRPLKKLNGAMSVFGDGVYEKVNADSGIFEFNNVLTTFNRMEDRLKESEDERKKLEEQRRKMLADISHDLKTPITVLRGYLDAMQDGLIPESEQKKYLKIMTGKTELMSDLITSFGEYSRLEHPDFKFTFEKGDLTEYLREYMAAKYEELDLAGYSVDIDIPEEEVVAEFDRKQLRRVFENIISNALKYTKAGTTIFVSMAVEDQKDGSAAVIRIGDNGPGMKEELKATAFQPFMIGDESRRSGKGTGLGLSIAKKITEGHHGTIRILSKEEWQHGTMYEIRLPLQFSNRGQVRT